MSEEQPVYRTYSADAFGGTDKRKDATIAQQRELIAELETMLSVITMNALLIPDPRMDGATDCYAVPLDDVHDARQLLAKARETTNA